MLLKKKPLLYLEFLERRIRYLVVDAQSHAVLEAEEVLFDTEIIHEGMIVDASLIENRLRALIAEKKWRNAKTSILLPDDYVVMKEEEIPVQLSPTEVKDYLALHMNHSIRVPFKQPTFHFEILEKGETEQTVMMMIYSNEIIEQYESILENVSLKLMAADISFLCLYRVMMHQEKVTIHDEKHLLIMQWSPVDTSITVFHEGVPLFNRHSRSTRLTESWNVTKEGEWVWKKSPEALEENIKDKLDTLERFLEFYRYSVMDGNEGVTEIILTGDIPNLEGIKMQLSNRFYLPIHMLAEPNAIATKFLPLYGLSLRERRPSGLKNKKVKSKKGERARV